MKSRILFQILVLTALTLAACAPQPAAPESAVSQEVVTTQASVAQAEPASPAAESAPAESVQPVATSRGDQLEATDPATVSLASGGIQLVEFFRFTWGTCRSMAPMVHGLEAKYYGKVKFSYLDADDSATKEFQAALGFYYQPEFYLLDGNGNVLKKFIGFVSQEEFEAEFAKHLE